MMRCAPSSGNIGNSAFLIIFRPSRTSFYLMQQTRRFHDPLPILSALLSCLHIHVYFLTISKRVERRDAKIENTKGRAYLEYRCEKKRCLN